MGIKINQNSQLPPNKRNLATKMQERLEKKALLLM